MSIPKPPTASVSREISAPRTCIREVTLQYSGPERPISGDLRDPEHAIAYLRRRVIDDAREHLVAIYLDARFRPIGDSLVSIGTANSSSAHPREVFQLAVMLGACYVLIAQSSVG